MIEYTPEEKAAAEAAWTALRESWLDMEQNLIDVIATKAWLPAGYTSFAECWQQRMAGAKLLPIVEARVIRQLIEDGLTDGEIAASMDGVGPAAAKKHRADKAADLPIAQAGRRRNNAEGKPRPRLLHHVFISVPNAQYQQIEAAADAAELTVEDYMTLAALHAAGHNDAA